MGIYDEGMSCWERRKAKLPPENAGKIVIGEVINDEKVAKEPLIEEVEVVEEETPKGKSTKQLKKILDKK